MSKKKYNRLDCTVVEKLSGLEILRDGYSLICPYSNRICGSSCPLFSIYTYENDTASVSLECGASTTISVINVEETKDIIFRGMN